MSTEMNESLAPQQFTPRWGAALRIKQVLSSSAVPRLLSPIVLLILWELLARAGVIPSEVIAAPSTIIRAFGRMIASGELLHHLGVSMKRAGLGLAIGITLGVALALLSGLSRIGEAVFDSPLQILRTLPFLAVIPLFILWFGIDETTKTALIAFGTTFPIYIALFSGIRNIDGKLVEMADTLQLGRFNLIRHVILPGALPAFFVGLRYSLSISLLALVAVEQVNANAGLGYLINEAREFAQTDVIIVCLLVYSIFGLLIDAAVRYLERHALAWRSSFLNN
jgi:sulfonate transport system permease protein